MSTRTFGARIERNIDPKLLRGEGAFVDDIPLTNPLHVAFLRSPLARARIKTDRRQRPRETIRASPRSIPATTSARSTWRCRC